MKDYLVNVTDTLEKSVVVRAEDEADALAKVNRKFTDEIMLDDIDDFDNREIMIVGIASEDDKRYHEFYSDEDAED